MASTVATITEWVQRYFYFLLTQLIFWPLVLIFFYPRASPRDIHIVVISATYFNASKSYPHDTMVVLFNAPNGILPSSDLTCWSRSNGSVTIAPASVERVYEPYYRCKWAAYVSTCPVLPNPEEVGLSDTDIFAKTVKLRYRLPAQARHDVVACFSPLFYFERWQLLIVTLEAYRQFGVSLQVFYVQSMLLDVVNFLNAYERLGLVSIEAWTNHQFEDGVYAELGYDPNRQLEWRNQASAHTDCLLLYKDAAEFIIVSDIDDILFPLLGASYLDEFRKLMFEYPLAAGFVYPRFNADYASATTPDDFSLSSLAFSTRIYDDRVTGKSVVRPDRVRSLWLHYPYAMSEPYYMKHLTEWDNFIVHFRKWREVDQSIGTLPKNHAAMNVYIRQIMDILSPANITGLDDAFREFVLIHAFKEYGLLPHRMLYYPLIEECYRQTFYSLSEDPESCPGPANCDLPVINGTMCTIAERKLERAEVRPGLFVHRSLVPVQTVVSDSGCRL